MIRLNEKWSVSQIDNPPQWTLCRKKMVKSEERWEPVSFCQRRETLLRAIREKVIHGKDFYPHSENLAVPAHKLARIEAFPETCGDGNETEEAADQG